MITTKFYKALGKLTEDEIVEGTSNHCMINEDWKNIKFCKDMKIQVRHQQEDATYNMCPYLEMIVVTEFYVNCMPWTPSVLDIFSDKWVVMKYNTKTGKEEIVR